MPWYLRNLMANAGLMEQANAGEGGGSGGGSAADPAADAAAAKAAADEAAAKTAAADAAKKPSDEEARLLKEVMDKKTKLKAAEEEKQALAAKLKEFEGIDIASVRALMNEKKQNETKKLEEKGEWDRLKAQMAEEHGKEKATLASQVSMKDGYIAQLQKTISELTVGNAFASSTFIKDDVTIPPSKVRALYGSHFEFNDGNVVAFDKAAGAADRTMLVDASGNPLSFESALKKIVEADADRDFLLRSKIKQGAGSKTAPKTTTPDTKIEQPTGAGRIAAALSKGALAVKK